MIFKIAHLSSTHLLNKKVNFTSLNDFIRKSFKNLPKHYSISYLDNDGDNIDLANQDDLDTLYQSFTGATVKLSIKPTSIETVDTQPEIIQEDVEEIKEVKEQVKQIKEVETTTMISEAELAKIIQTQVEQMLPSLTESIRSEIKSKSQIKTTDKPKESLQTKEVIHEGYTCDGCGVKPIVGIRYKCSICADFDFCEKCEDSTEHSHPFLKIRNLNQKTKVLFTVLQDNATTDMSKLLEGGLANIPNLINQFAPQIQQFKQQFGGWKGGCKKFFCQKRNEESTKTEQPKQEEQKKCEQKQECMNLFEEVPQFKQDGFASQEERNLTYATMIQELFEQDSLNEVLDIVVQYPNLSREELIEKIIETKTINEKS